MPDNVTLAINDDPQEPRDSARVVVTVCPQSGPDTFPEVQINGSRDGLIWLAKRVLEIAYANQEMHTHLDNEATHPIYQSPEGWWLTLSRIDRPRDLARLAKRVT